MFGIRLTLTDPGRYDPVLTALTLLAAVRAVHPGQIGFVPHQFDRLAGGPEVREALEIGVAPDALVERWKRGIEAFERRRAPYLLYR